ncbi:MAG: leucine-rich repeat protein [Muribaculaceae bacterium]|nr:leucine-rich repeat protein [Muribaculaceae bacterium]
MKKFLMLFVSIAAMLPASMSAYDFKEGDIYYNVDGNEAAVTFEIEGVGSYSGDVVIPETVVHNGVEYAVTAIGYKAFLNCYNLTSIEIPNSIDSISSHAFRSCEKLQSVVIPNSVVTLYPCAFHSCTGLKSVVIGNSVRVIDEYCFQYCYQLTDVVIGSSVEYLEIKAFYDCYSLRDVTCLAMTPPAMYEWYSFYDYNYENVTVHVPASAMDAYKADQYWGMFNQYVSLTMATGLTLDKSLVSLNGGEQVQLTATIEPADAISAVEWTTSNSNVAIVNSNGMVTAVGAGEAVITAATLDGSGLTAQCVVLVGLTSIKEMNAAVRIYAQGEDIVVVTPVEMPVEFIMTNGMSRTVTAKAGVNVYPAGHGIHIVRAAGQVAKLKI